MKKWLVFFSVCFAVLLASCEKAKKVPYVEIVSMYNNNILVTDACKPIQIGDTLTIWVNLYGYDNFIERLDVSLDRSYVKDSVFLTATERGLYCDSYNVSSGEYIFTPQTKNLQVPVYIMPKTLPDNQQLPQTMGITLKTDLAGQTIGSNPYTMSLQYYISE